MDENVTASLTKHRRTTLERIEKYISDTYFTDVNLFGKLYPHSREFSSIKHWRVPGGEGSWQQWKVESILKQKESFTPVKIGDTFGPSWSTHWFEICFCVPDEWEGEEVRFRWKSQSEAMIWDPEGRPLQGLSTGTSHQLRTDFCVSKKWDPKEGGRKTYFIEMSCSRMFGLGSGGMINPPNANETFRLEMAQVCVFDSSVYALLVDLGVLHDLAKHLPDDQRGYRALYAGNQMINDLIAGSASRARAVSQSFFSRGNGASAITLALVGNCHIDSAWLWPYSETKRKCARSWASTLRLMEDYPEMVFACSQAQQLEWVKECYPDLYAEIKARSEGGKFVHVGATWVEMDGLIPSGESFMRQFLYGQKFFKRELGSESNIFWLPDTFGYSAQIPQICKHFGIPYFLTQKLSWNLVNKFPHHTFVWEGIDGSSVLAHFPPGDSYEMNVNVEEALRSERQLRDKGRSSLAGFLFGHGDGGGGPTQDMLERARRLADVDGCPRMVHMSPGEMFRKLDSERRNLCRWVGELYLELHNGTYTSQAKTKAYNRRCEFLLREVEFLLAMVASHKRATAAEITEKRGECEAAWKKVLLNQFHDVLPGSSIGLVYRDSDALYEEATRACRRVRDFCVQKLSSQGASNQKGALSIVNLLPWPVRQLIEVEEVSRLKGLEGGCVQASAEKGGKTSFLAVEAPPLSYTPLDVTSPPAPSVAREARLLRPPSISVDQSGNVISLENRFTFARLTTLGELTELVDKQRGSRNVFETTPASEGRRHSGNRITLYDDVPLFWDAWDVMDYHLETRKVLNSKENEANIRPLRQVESGPLKVSFELEIGSVGEASSLTQRVVMTAVEPALNFETKVRWREAHKFLKVEFETGLLARSATYEIQFGHLRRPTHTNTSWDAAKFEVCGHKWANIGEFDLGLSVLNDCKYGWSAKGGTLALSLLRAPKAPDDECDMGEHSFKYAAMPHKGSLQRSGTIEASYEFNSSLTALRETPVSGGVSRWFDVVGEGVMIETAKVAESGGYAFVLRLYEMYGSTCSVWLKTELVLAEVYECNGMEERTASLAVSKGPLPGHSASEESCAHVQLQFHPFQIKTLLLVPL